MNDDIRLFILTMSLTCVVIAVAALNARISALENAFNQNVSFVAQSTDGTCYAKDGKCD